MTGASVTALVVGQDAAITFYDDGQHGDGAAGVGTYGATTGTLPGGDSVVEAKAEAGGEFHQAAAAFTVGAANKSAKR